VPFNLLCESRNFSFASCEILLIAWVNDHHINFSSLCIVCKLIMKLYVFSRGSTVWDDNLRCCCCQWQILMMKTFRGVKSINVNRAMMISKDLSYYGTQLLCFVNLPHTAFGFAVLRNNRNKFLLWISRKFVHHTRGGSRSVFFWGGGSETSLHICL